MEPETLSPASGLLEAELAQLTSRLLNEQVAAGISAVDFQELWGRYAGQLRQEAQTLLHRPGRQEALLGLAAEFESHYATWHLLVNLFHYDLPINVGGPSLPSSRTLRQSLADWVAGAGEAARCVQVLAWLESLAGLALKDSNTTLQFGHGDGVWLETLYVLRRAAETPAGSSVAHGVVSELDPDAPFRQGLTLHRDSQQHQERILHRVWQLVRSGHLNVARDLCMEVGQYWRAVSLAGAGETGPMPIAVEDDLKASDVLTQLATEVESGSMVRLLWRWACSKIATQQQPQGSKQQFEAAVYGSLSGQLENVLSVCNTWEDACWALLRCWLEQQVSEQLQTQLPSQPEEMVSSDLVQSALLRCGVNPTTARSALDSALRASTRGSMSAPDDSPRLSDRLTDLFDFLKSTTNPTVQQEAKQLHRAIQVEIILARMDEVVKKLKSSHDAMQQEILQTDQNGTLNTADLSAPMFRQLAYSCHLLISLQALNRLTPPPDGRIYTGFHMMAARDELLQAYIDSLVKRPALRPQAPVYLALLPSIPRTVQCHKLLEVYSKELIATAAEREVPHDDPLALTLCSAAHELSTVFQQCCERQQLEVRNGLETDISHDELRQQLHQFTSSCCASPEYGPLARVQVSRWQLFPLETFYPIGNQSDQHTNEPTSDLMSGLLGDALSLLCKLCCELSMGDDITRQAGATIFQDVLPADFSSKLNNTIEAASDLYSAAHILTPEEREYLSDQLPRAEALAGQLSSWQQYYELQSRLHTWLQQCDSGQTGASAQHGSLLLQSSIEIMLMGRWMTDAIPSQEESSSMQLLLTVRPEPGVDVWSHPVHPFPKIQAGELPALKQAVEQAIACAPYSSVEAKLLHTETSFDYIHVSLSTGTSAAERGALISLAQELVQGGLPGLPPSGFLLVRCEAVPSLVTELAQRCCLAQIVDYAVQVRNRLVEMGGNGAVGGELMLLLAGAHGDLHWSRKLVNAVPRSTLRRLLQIEAETETTLRQR